VAEIICYVYISTLCNNLEHRLSFTR